MRDDSIRNNGVQHKHLLDFLATERALLEKQMRCASLRIILLTAEAIEFRAAQG